MLIKPKTQAWGFEWQLEDDTLSVVFGIVSLFILLFFFWIVRLFAEDGEVNFLAWTCGILEGSPGQTDE